MISGLVNKLLKKNDAPDWFCAEMKKHTPEAEIKAMIRHFIEIEIQSRDYNRDLWNDELIKSMTGLYFKYFDQLYMQSA